ncbi:uncharacterized protein MONBRDRAFT_34498 [Monosiga brevicollis MX1]|uniref:Formin-like protein n=1 Tax=Monosiga brevicollis TaxID=81824 RepID=A9VC36_MONBE|nr:uncharacterized protein MONBRDRAFT_34498 [Monosiga brevicollis MX1]EDQ84913.1 predicted protein [Monosiga brevicollis MX1]|eukprot:XP_001750254.1 hypothetical protein [Monosiga brevicollis MX1]
MGKKLFSRSADLTRPEDVRAGSAHSTPSHRGTRKLDVNVMRPDDIGGPMAASAPLTTEEMPPVPQRDVLEQQLTGVLESMNIPRPKRAEIMNQSDEKKWQLVWAQMKVKARYNPSHYLDSLIIHLDAAEKARRKNTKKKTPPGVEEPASILRGIEISLRTNPLSWVKDFINYQPTIDERNKDTKQRAGGLDILMEYFSSLENDERHSDDNYLCVLCLRALMNNATNAFLQQNIYLALPSRRPHSGAHARKRSQFGFNTVMAHPDTINQICLCLGSVDPFSTGSDELTAAEEGEQSRRYRTHILVLELLAAVCLVSKGHARILQAFDNFQRLHQEKQRFMSIMHLLRSERHHVAVMVACMAFVNVVVHCVPDMNYQVALQEEFSKMGLMSLIDDLAKSAAPDLQEQINAYQENFINVAELARDAEAHAMDLERISQLEEQLEDVKAELKEVSALRIEETTELKNEVSDLQGLLGTIRARLQEEKDRHAATQVQATQDVSSLKSDLQGARDRLVAVEQKLAEAESISASIARLNESQGKVDRSMLRDVGVNTDGDAVDVTSPPPAPGPPPAAPLPPPPPPPAPPPAPGSAFAVQDLNAGGNKRRVEVHAKLPMLNWTTLSQAQVADTIFKDLDDDKVLDEVDFSSFTEAFRLDTQGGDGASRDSHANNVVTTLRRKATHGPDTVLDLNRARNLAIAQRRVGTDVDAVIAGINRLDLKVVTAEKAELLRSEYMASDEEMSMLTERHDSGKPMAEVDVFLYHLNRVPRLRQKLMLLSYLDSCDEVLHSLSPAANKLETASRSLVESQRLRQLLSIVLAFGNYMNSQRRGGAYGFKLSVFTRLFDTRSRDRSQSVLNYVVAAAEEMYPDCLQFADELHCIDKAAGISIASLEQNLLGLERTAKAVSQELELDATHEALLHFRDTVLPQIHAARDDVERARAAFRRAVEFFAEDEKAEPYVFFKTFLQLDDQIKQAQEQNRRRAEAQARAAEEARQQAAEDAQRKEAMLRGDALQSLPVGGPRKATLQPRTSIDIRDEVADGDIDSLISGLKEQGYRRGGVKTQRGRDRGDAYGAARPWLK